MRVAIYARVSTQRQAIAQTIEQQLERLKDMSKSKDGNYQKRTYFGMMVSVDPSLTDRTGSTAGPGGGRGMTGS